MYISPIRPSVSFGHVEYADNIKKRLLSPHCSSAFKYDLDNVESVLCMLGADSKEYVDVIIHHSFDEGFYGVISSKKQGIPINPAYKCKISNKTEDISKFDTWLDAWNEAYSPKALEGFRKTLNLIRNLGKK